MSSQLSVVSLDPRAKLDKIASRYQQDADRIRAASSVIDSGVLWPTLSDHGFLTELGGVEVLSTDLANQITVTAVSCIDVAVKDLRITLATSYLMLRYHHDTFKMTFPASVARIAVEEMAEGRKWDDFGQGYALAEDAIRRNMARENFQGWSDLVNAFKEVGVKLSDLVEEPQFRQEIVGALGIAESASTRDTWSGLKTCFDGVANRRHEIVHRLGYDSAQLGNRQEPLPFREIDRLLTVAGLLIERSIDVLKLRCDGRD